MSRNTTRHARKVAAVVGAATALAFAPLASTAVAAPGTAAGASAAADASAPATVWRQVSAGSYHTCAVTRAGAAKCWGHNVYGQLGDGTVTDRRTPVQVVGLESGVRSVASGGASTCALTTAGAVKCWGWNRWGTLGNGSSVAQSTRPVQVRGLETGARSVAVGASHACAVNSGGALKCWGWNDDGQLGDGTYQQRRTPVQVHGLRTGVRQVTTGFGHSCAILVSGAAKCWGWNFLGHLGDGTSQRRLVPVAVKTLDSGVESIDAGVSHTCAVLTTGAAKCWGWNINGAVGDGSGQRVRYQPTQVKYAESGILAIATGDGHSCLATTDGRIRCFGIGASGDLGYGGRANRNAPITVKGLSSASAAVSAGEYHSCAITTDGALKCWGNNSFGKLGDGTTRDRLTPVNVRG